MNDESLLPQTGKSGKRTFSLRRLLASVTLIALGFAVWIFAIDRSTARTSGGLLILWLFSGMYFGAAILLPFGLERFGAVLGMFLQFALLLVWSLFGFR